MTVGPSSERHYLTSLGKLQNSLIAISGYYYQSSSVEIFENGFWQKSQDFPHTAGALYHYSMVTKDDLLYVVGMKIYFFINLHIQTLL